jgi:hypothetical protein
MDMLLGAHWMARVQYRFADFGYPFGGSCAFNFTDVRTCSGCASAVNPLTVSYEFLLMQHISEDFARAVSGHAAAAPPRSDMNSPRFS